MDRSMTVLFLLQNKSKLYNLFLLKKFKVNYYFIFFIKQKTKISGKNYSQREVH